MRPVSLLPPDIRADGFHDTAYNLTADLQHIEAYGRLAATIVRRMSVETFAAGFTSCREPGEACMRELIATMGKWLLRGPLTGAEGESFLRVSAVVTADGGNRRLGPADRAQNPIDRIRA